MPDSPTDTISLREIYKPKDYLDNGILIIGLINHTIPKWVNRLLPLEIRLIWPLLRHTLNAKSIDFIYNHVNNNDTTKIENWTEFVKRAGNAIVTNL